VARFGASRAQHSRDVLPTCTSLPGHSSRDGPATRRSRPRHRVRASPRFDAMAAVALVLVLLFGASSGRSVGAWIVSRTSGLPSVHIRSPSRRRGRPHVRGVRVGCSVLAVAASLDASRGRPPPGRSAVVPSACSSDRPAHLPSTHTRCRDERGGGRRDGLQARRGALIPPSWAARPTNAPLPRASFCKGPCRVQYNRGTPSHMTYHAVRSASARVRRPSVGYVRRAVDLTPAGVPTGYGTRGDGPVNVRPQPPPVCRALCLASRLVVQRARR
jgi:hypothetical protein